MSEREELSGFMLQLTKGFVEQQQKMGGLDPLSVPAAPSGVYSGDKYVSSSLPAEQQVAKPVQQK